MRQMPPTAIYLHKYIQYVCVCRRCTGNARGPARGHIVRACCILYKYRQVNVDTYIRMGSTRHGDKQDGQAQNKNGVPTFIPFRPSPRLAATKCA